jgi:hypothetical protein
MNFGTYVCIVLVQRRRRKKEEERNKIENSRKTCLSGSKLHAGMRNAGACMQTNCMCMCVFGK